MSDLGKLSCVVLDHGPFLEVALRLARDVGKVYYVCPQWEEAFSHVDEAVIGDGYAEIERVAEIWDVIDKVDFAVFPDVHHGAMQLAIEKHVGLPVWGARRADNLEIKKLQFKKLQEKLGMEFAPYDVLEGLEALREFCLDPKNAGRWIKGTPQFRGAQETFQVKDWESAQQIVDAMNAHFGPLGRSLTFLAEHPIKTNIEGGIDTYTVDGQHPEKAVLGYEAKDHCYFAVVKDYDEISPLITDPCESLWPLFKEFGCRQMFSTEVKVTKEKKSILLEPTVRFPSPAGEEQMEIYGNFAEIIEQGARGVLIQPEIEHEFACEAMVEHHGNDEHWRWLKVPKEVRRWVKLYSTVEVDGWTGTAPGCDIIGAVVGVGDTPEEALEHLKENVEQIKDQPVTVHVEALAGILEEIEEAESKGIEFSDEPLPEPAAVLE